MSQIEGILQKIEVFRIKINELIEEKGDLLDSEVVSASQTLDKALNDYAKIIKNQRK